MDGSIFNNPFGLDAATPGGQTNAQPISLDALDQIQVSLAPYDVTQAGFTGASVNAVTKSGTNEVHGTVYGFFRNQDLTGSKVDGEDIFVPDLTQTQFGVSIGGPSLKINSSSLQILRVIRERISVLTLKQIVDRAVTTWPGSVLQI